MPNKIGHQVCSILLVDSVSKNMAAIDHFIQKFEKHTFFPDFVWDFEWQRKIAITFLFFDIGKKNLGFLPNLTC